MLILLILSIMKRPLWYTNYNASHGKKREPVNRATTSSSVFAILLHAMETLVERGSIAPTHS
jgi:hypothetical protein